MELDTLGNVVLLTQATVTLAILFWLGRDSPKRRRTAIWATVMLVVCWLLDHLEAVYRVHGREGLKDFPGEDVCFLYWCLQHEVREITQKIESGRGLEFDALIKEQLVVELKELRIELAERHDRLRETELVR